LHPVVVPAVAVERASVRPPDRSGGRRSKRIPAVNEQTGVAQAPAQTGARDAFGEHGVPRTYAA
jgi:hypothetical protein